MWIFLSHLEWKYFSVLAAATNMKFLHERLLHWICKAIWRTEREDKLFSALIKHQGISVKTQAVCSGMWCHLRWPGWHPRDGGLYLYALLWAPEPGYPKGLLWGHQPFQQAAMEWEEMRRPWEVWWQVSKENPTETALSHSDRAWCFLLWSLEPLRDLEGVGFISGAWEASWWGWGVFQVLFQKPRLRSLFPLSWVLTPS